MHQRWVVAVFVSLMPLQAAGGVTPSGLVEGAFRQIGVTTIYDGRYQQLDYPGGDVAPERGVCTDVIIRAYRHIGIDLQVLVHEDMRQAWRHYPKLWNLRAPDSNIDHRRVPNLQAFFRRQGASLPISKHPADYLAGDLVTWRLPSGVPHIGIVSNRRIDERYLIVHNIGDGTVLEDLLFTYPITGHYRYFPNAR